MHNQQTIDQEATTYSVIHINDLVLVIDQKDIIGIESVFDINSNEDNDTTNGSMIVLNNKTIPVFHIDKDLIPLNQIPSSRHACIILHSGNIFYAISVDSVHTLPHGKFSCFSLPGYMLTEKSSVTQVIKTEDGYLGILDTDKLVEALNINPVETEISEVSEVLLNV